VSLRAPEADPSKRVGTYVAAEDWNKLISDPDIVVVDVRNDYEVAMGSFAGALNPNTASFTQFKDFVGEHLKPKRDTRIAMFCTGGIRCEKASAYLLAHGFEEVYHLNGGILRYLEVVPEDASLWQGACFVFDERVGVSHGLVVSDHILCRACRRPLSSEDRAHGDYIEGTQCAYCRDERTAAQKEGAAERHRQVAIAESRGKAHIGCEADVVQLNAGASASGEKVSRRG
ncbi:MAG: rhodanese-like domain-containing protein, partial [Hyphomicrobiaceae bacterium]